MAKRIPHRSLLRRFISEIHRRSLWQVLGIYVVGAWLIYQVVLGLTDGLGLPSWVPPVAFVLFLIGLPIVVATAFVQEGPPSAPRGRRNRPGRASAKRRAVEPAEPGAPVAASDPAQTVMQRVLTWPRALLGGVLAFALLGAGTTGWMGMRAIGIGPAGSLMATGVLEPSGRILIADFDTPSGDSVLARVVTETFRIDFSRSTLVTPVEPGSVRDVLRRMGRDGVSRLDAEIAREVALRDGIPALITGEVTATAGSYVLTARVVAAETGEAVAAFRETAADSTRIIRAIDRLSRAVRERTGESLRTIRRAEPLEQVTTNSLEALQRYTEGRRAQNWEGDVARARSLFEEAVALDSAFASAHRAIAVSLFNNEDHEGALTAIERALRFQNRLTDIERYHVLAQQHLIRREYRDAIRAYELVLSRAPNDFPALNNTGVAYGALGEVERSLEYMRRVIEIDTTRFFGYANLGEGLVLAGRFREAEAAWTRAVELAAEPSWAAVHLAMLPWVQNDHAGAEAALRSLAAAPEATNRTQEFAAFRLLWILGARGRFAEFERGLETRLPPNMVDWAVAARQYWRELFVHGRPDRARTALGRLIALATADTALPSARRLELAEACGWIGDVTCARRELERAGYAGPLSSAAPYEAFAAHGALALAERDYLRAIRNFRLSASWRCLACEEGRVARAFEFAGQVDSAIVAYRRFVDTPSIYRFRADLVLGPALERLAELYEERGDTPAAAALYVRLIDLWNDADPELHPRVAAARERLAALRPDR
jgi:eukaryotic-like serine/threonine-protein kinase